MPCFKVKSRPTTLGDLRKAMGSRSEGYPPHVLDPKQGAANVERAKRDWDRAQNSVVPGGEFVMCGRDLHVEMCLETGCEYQGETLCDWPMGKGKTCDIALCTDHAKHIGEDRDLCPIHFAMWVEATRTERVNEWPPKKGT